MLAEYDLALAHAKEQVVATHHGVVGEAAVRDWLANFLPKRYGVVAGYIRSQGPSSEQQSAHFDVIIYDQIEAPILWIEINKDKSESGRARIIPAENVRAIIEVKAAFNRRSVRVAVAKLAELEPLIAGVDSAGANYPKYLPASAVLAMMFFELRNADATDVDPLNLIRDLQLRRPFYGAMILRGEGLHPDDTALIRQLQSEQAFEGVFPGGGLLRGYSISGSKELNGSHMGAMSMWSDINFSQFAFDLLALLSGTYRQGFASSFHGLDLSQFYKSK